MSQLEIKTMKQYPQYRFLQFKQENYGKFDIPGETYEELVARMRCENEQQMELELSSGVISEETEEKIFNRLKKFGLSDTYKVNDVISLHKSTSSSKDPLEILGHKLRTHEFAIATSRQNPGEIYCEICLEYVATQFNDFKWDKLSGKNSKWVDNGQIVSQKPLNAIETKSLDYSIMIGDTQIYAAQKRMKISKGGHQDNQKSELLRFAKETASAETYIPLAILDGAITTASMTQIVELNEKIIFLQSDDFLYFTKWLDDEKQLTNIQQKVT